MIVEREGPDQVCYGAGGRKYVIHYALGNKRPWYINDRTDWEQRFDTLDEAVAKAHELEAVALGEDRWR